MKIKLSKNAQKHYQYWIDNDRKILKRINELLKETQNSPYDGKGKPEALKFNLTGFWSRRINHEHRLVYKIENDVIYVVQCRYHY